MEKTTLYLLVGCLLLVSLRCGSNRMQTEEIVAYTEPYQPQGCFAFLSGGSRAFLEVKFTGDVVQGRLTYLLEGKDSNRGTYLGKLVDNSIVAVYTFESEGMTSTREVVFRTDGQSWTEGYGPVDVGENGVVFSDPAALEFENGLDFSSVPCSGTTF